MERCSCPAPRQPGRCSRPGRSSPLDDNRAGRTSRAAVAWRGGESPGRRLILDDPRDAAGRRTIARGDRCCRPRVLRGAAVDGQAFHALPHQRPHRTRRARRDVRQLPAAGPAAGLPHADGSDSVTAGRPPRVRMNTLGVPVPGGPRTSSTGLGGGNGIVTESDEQADREEPACPGRPVRSGTGSGPLCAVPLNGTRFDQSAPARCAGERIARHPRAGPGRATAQGGRTCVRPRSARRSQGRWHGNGPAGANRSPVMQAAEVRYDFVVVGGGTAGSVIAARLSQDERASVLLLEAGDGRAPAVGAVPPPWPALLQTSADWGDTTVPQAATGSRCPWPVGGYRAAASRSTPWRSCAATARATTRGRRWAPRAGASTICCRTSSAARTPSGGTLRCAARAVPADPSRPGHRPGREPAKHASLRGSTGHAASHRILQKKFQEHYAHVFSALARETSAQCPKTFVA